jgi:hypothetical protein
VAELNSRPISESTFADLLKPLIQPAFRLALAMLHDVSQSRDRATQVRASQRGA